MFLYMRGRLPKENKIIIITGQTATGKTTLAFKLANRFNGRLVSFDSRQCYKYMDIITGKDTDEFIYMYDEYDPKIQINAYDYIVRADKYIESILKEGKIPIIVGGSMFYIKSYLQGLHYSSSSIDWEKRSILEAKTLHYLQKKLFQIDSKAFYNMNSSDFKNKRRLIRAIERANQKNTNNKILRNKLPYIIVCLTGENNFIKNQINKRVVERLERGAIEEVEFLLQKGYSPDDPGMKTMGYLQLVNFIKGIYTKEEAVNLWFLSEYHYAKRQKTYMRQFGEKVVFNVEDNVHIEKIIKLVYKWLNDL